MIFNLSAGEVLRIGDVATFTVLAVEGDLVHLRLETAEGVRSAVGEVGKDCTGASCTQRASTWAWN
jgi:sRNA-binding carbon storage regulator CsrA